MNYWPGTTRAKAYSIPSWALALYLKSTSVPKKTTLWEWIKRAWRRWR